MALKGSEGEKSSQWADLQVHILVHTAHEILITSTDWVVKLLEDRGLMLRRISVFHADDGYNTLTAEKELEMMPYRKW